MKKNEAPEKVSWVTRGLAYGVENLIRPSKITVVKEAANFLLGVIKNRSELRKYHYMGLNWQVDRVNEYLLKKGYTIEQIHEASRLYIQKKKQTNF